MSGGIADRPELEKCLERLEKGDTLVVWRLDRLGRSIRDLLRIVDGLDKSGVRFVSLKERFDTGTAAGRLIFHFFAALAQFEKELVRERTMAGFSAARACGRLGGRSRLLTPQQAKVVKTMRGQPRPYPAGDCDTVQGLGLYHRAQSTDFGSAAEASSHEAEGREVMRVLCSTIHGTDVEGEVIGGEGFDPETETCGLESIFTVRCDDGRLYQVHGWLVDVTILEKPSKFYLM